MERLRNGGKIGMLALVVLLLVTMLFLGVWVNPANSGTPKPTPSPAAREVLIIGTSQPGGVYYQVGVSLTKLLLTKTDIKSSVFPQSGPGAWLSVLKEGNVDFGTDQGVSLSRAVKGDWPYTEKYPIRLIQATFVFDVTAITGIKSDIKTLKDIKGKRLTYGFSGSSALQINCQAFLANAGYTEKDIAPVLIAGFSDAMDAMMDGRADILMGMGFNPVPKSKEWIARIGARFIPMDTSPEAVARTQKVAPDNYPKMVPADDINWQWLESTDPKLDIKYPFAAMASPVCLVARTNLSEDIVYNVSKATWKNYEVLGADSPLFKRDWKPENMVPANFSVPYHSGAIKWFKEKGVWTAKHEKLNKQLLAELREAK